MPMHPFPHNYEASATAQAAGLVTTHSPQLPDLSTSAPPEFDGPAGTWSPETLLCASLANCFVLTFRAIARGARFDWLDLQCRVEGTLEREGRNSRFTRFRTFARLTLPSGADAAVANELLEKAEQGCLIANSLVSARVLESEIVLAD